MKIYVVEMKNNLSEHSYILGCYSSKVHAEFDGDVEVSWRGCKYHAIVREYNLDEGVDFDKLEYHRSVMN